jgi:hypothetical protein
MTLKNIPNLRLISQQIIKPEFKSPKEIVGWMGAMQAQDFNMAKWAIGLRLNKATEKNIELAINSGEILRTHVLRPTWHFVSQDDIWWMLDLTAQKLKASLKGRHKQLELTESILNKSNKIIQKTLAEKKFATRKELIIQLNKAKIPTNENRASHIFLNAELNKIICSGKMKGKENTYALLSERANESKSFNRQNALAMLATKYFKSHCPATLRDFVWWSGLNLTDAKNGLEMIKKDLIAEKINDEEYWFHDSLAVSEKNKSSVFLLPAFDEFLISYKDRSASIINEHASKAFSKNGIFWPTIVVNGKVAGTWKRQIQKEKVLVTLDVFDSKNKLKPNSLKKESEKFGFFLDKKTEIATG